MSNTSKLFTVAFGFAFGIVAGALAATAASGDLRYVSKSERVDITAEQTACFAQCAIEAGSWDGEPGDVIRTCAERNSASLTGFSAITMGIKSSPAKDLPVGVNDDKKIDSVKVIGIEK